MNASRSKLAYYGTAALAVFAALAFQMRHAFGDGPPTVEPLVYSGVLQENGIPVNGTRTVVVNIWSAETGGMQLCTTSASTTFTSGSFAVPLAQTCTGVVHANPEAWLEVVVAGVSYGRTKIAASPYALEAGRASDLVPSLRSSLVPAGTIVAFAGAMPPTGWLLCDGSSVSRTSYAALFAAIGTGYGDGDGTAMTFSLPDLRGRFIRGVDHGAANDPDAQGRATLHHGGNAGDAVGSLETDALASHQHSGTTDPSGGHSHTGTTDPVGDHQHTEYVGGMSGPCGLGVQGTSACNNNGSINPTAPAGGHSHTFTTSSVGDHTHTFTTDSTGGHETRPENVSVNWIIKT